MPAMPMPPPIFDPANPALTNAVLANLSALATPAVPAIPRAPAGYVPSPGVPGSLAAAMKPPATPGTPLAPPTPPPGYVPPPGLPGTLARALGGAPQAALAQAAAPAVAPSPAPAPGVPPPMSLAEYLKAHPVPEEKPETFQRPSLLRRLLFGAAAGAAGWGRPEVGAAMVDRYNQAIAQREQQTDAFNRELPVANQAREEQAYDQYLGQEARKAQIANAASEIESRGASDAARRQQVSALLAREGYRLGADGSLETIPEQELPAQVRAQIAAKNAANDALLAQIQLHRAQTDLATAKAALARAQNDPNSPAFRLAAERERIAEQNAAAAAQRAESYMGRYLMNAEGVDLNGNPLPGFAVDPDSGLPLGTAAAGNPTTQARSRADWAMQGLVVADDLTQAIDAADRSGELGPVLSRWSEFKAGKIGIGDVTYTKLRTFADIFDTGFMRAHMSSEAIEAVQHFKSLLDSGKMTAAEMKSALGVMRKALVGYARGGRLGTPSPFDSLLPGTAPLGEFQSGSRPAVHRQAPAPASHAWSQAAWSRANPRGDVRAAEAAARAAGYEVIP